MAWRTLSAVLGLFSEEQTRQRAALACQELAQAGAFADAGMESLVLCLAAYVTGDEQAYLAQYRLLEQDWPTLPCSDADLYVAACQIRLRSQETEDIIYGFIPEALSDLGDRRVRHAIGLAFAKSAALHASTNARTARGELDSALELLGYRV